MNFPIKVRHKVYKNYAYVAIAETSTHWITSLTRSKAHGGYLSKEVFEILLG